MAKVPIAGAVKTRLAREIGVAGAVRFARAAAAALLGRVGRDPRWQTTIAVAPDGGVANRAWPAALRRTPQGGGDLGARMQRILDRAPCGPVVIIGTDVPGIEPHEIAAAFRLLGSRDAVLGPAADGGYWLVGLKRRPHILRPFGGVRWSGPHALADTLQNIAGCRVGFAATLADVDDAAGLAASADRMGRRVLPRSAAAVSAIAR
jgi:rSAM/selenodomain-associated transferase 1